MAAHRDDSLRAELLCGHDAEQTNRAVTNHGNRLSRSGLSSHSLEAFGLASFPL
jgi:hypothetical protein